MPAWLYPMTRELEAIMACVDPDTGELPDNLSERLDAIGLTLDSRVESVLKAARQEKADSVAYGAEAERLLELSALASRRAERFTEDVHQCLKAAKLRKLKTPLFNVTVSNNSAPSVTVDDISNLPSDLKRIIPEKTEPDKRRIADRWRAGETLPAGVRVEIGTHLRVR